MESNTIIQLNGYAFDTSKPFNVVFLSPLISNFRVNSLDHFNTIAMTARKVYLGDRQNEKFTFKISGNQEICEYKKNDYWEYDFTTEKCEYKTGFFPF